MKTYMQHNTQAEWTLNLHGVSQKQIMKQHDSAYMEKFMKG